MEIDRVLRPGDKIRVYWGTYGQVEAVITHLGKNGEIYARRYRPKMRNYTNSRKVYPVFADERGNFYDVRKPAVEPVEAAMM